MYFLTLFAAAWAALKGPVINMFPGYMKPTLSAPLNF